jgi:hypothetical protein
MKKNAPLPYDNGRFCHNNAPLYLMTMEDFVISVDATHILLLHVILHNIWLI